MPKNIDNAKTFGYTEALLQLAYLDSLTFISCEIVKTLV